MNSEKVIIFPHIVKTGGSTLQSILMNEYKSDTLLLYHNPPDQVLKDKNGIIEKIRKQQRNLKAIIGHFSFDLYFWHVGESILSDFKLSKPVRYITMLRDPVDRIISLFYYLKSFHPDPMFKQNFEDFIFNRPLELKNIQTLTLTGRGMVSLEMAKKNLDTHFEVAGITEMFNESVFLMKKAFGWKLMSYEKKNITTKRPSRDDLPRDVIKKIQKDDYLDIELYNYAKEILEKKIDSLDSHYKDKLVKFTNTQMNRMHKN
ncbi:sulfotransferase family 2 domain-containing protein [Lihuaxuella thermophila]|uniref:Sulfotransferase family protein n=1 Tax=Lihuaxuella thermophila TaxID=1173111 RepID=A0A1H8DY87_9BACL|nr:sulfotransferase family 2 domain-containing protein [Lihuaxuella thermophila]SEN12150.1 Sulfotransferase family protein [Lihuaxuella thermophila]